MAGFMACLIAVVVMGGGHWAALQTVAWGRMIADFSRQDSLGTAISMTLSGKHPCALCHKIRKAWHEEKQREQKLPWEKPEQMSEPFWGLRCMTIPAVPTVALHEQPFVPIPHADFVESPPTPPPRLLFVTL